MWSSTLRSTSVDKGESKLISFIVIDKSVVNTVMQQTERPLCNISFCHPSSLPPFHSGQGWRHARHEREQRTNKQGAHCFHPTSSTPPRPRHILRRLSNSPRFLDKIRLQPKYVHSHSATSCDSRASTDTFTVNRHYDYAYNLPRWDERRMASVCSLSNASRVVRHRD